MIMVFNNYITCHLADGLIRKLIQINTINHEDLNSKQ